MYFISYEQFKSFSIESDNTSEKYLVESILKKYLSLEVDLSFNTLISALKILAIDSFIIIKLKSNI